MEDEEFNLFDDKQIEQLNTVEKKEDDTTDTTDDASTDDSASEDNQADSEGTDDSSDTSDGEESSEAEESEDDADSDADEDKDASADASSDQEKKDDEALDEAEKFATKDDIKAALAEQAAITESQQTARKTLRNELRGELFPDGIDVDLQIKDSDNGIITGPSQIAGKLINPKTQELFTYEEAKDYWDTAQKQIDRTIEEREQLIDSYAENNQSFYDGAQIVKAKYGAFLDANPEVAEKLLKNYFATAAETTASGYITNIRKNVVEYYDDVMLPMKTVASQLELQRQGEEQRKADEAAKADQSDRADLPVNNTTKPQVKEDKLSSAFGRYFEGK